MFGLFPQTAKTKGESEQIQIAGRLVKVIRRPYKRSLGLTLKLNGELRVSAPKGVPLSKIRDFILSQDEWIQTHLAKYQTLRDAIPKKRLVDGEQLPFLGRMVTLKFRPTTSSKRPILKFEGDLLVCEVAREVWSHFNPDEPHPELRAGLSAFYQKQARALLIDRIRHYSHAMGLLPSGLTFRAQKTRWGSCSSKGKISLNWKLIIAPLEIIDYVVVHELAHLKFYNHSQSFWNLVGTQVTDYQGKREWLRVHQYDADFLSAQSEVHEA